MKVIKFILLIGLVFLLSGCSQVFMPYQENPTCSKGKYNGYCGSVSDVYEIIEEKYR